jgi:hypothetical protein
MDDDKLVDSASVPQGRQNRWTRLDEHVVDTGIRERTERAAHTVSITVRPSFDTECFERSDSTAVSSIARHKQRLPKSVTDHARRRGGYGRAGQDAANRLSNRSASVRIANSELRIVDLQRGRTDEDSSCALAKEHRDGATAAPGDPGAPTGEEPGSSIEGQRDFHTYEWQSRANPHEPRFVLEPEGRVIRSEGDLDACGTRIPR